MAGGRGPYACPPRPHSVVVRTAVLEGVVGTSEYIASWSEARGAWNPQSADGVQSEGSLLGICTDPGVGVRVPRPTHPGPRNRVEGNRVTTPKSPHSTSRAWGPPPEGGRTSSPTSSQGQVRAGPAALVSPLSLLHIFGNRTVIIRFIFYLFVVTCGILVP